MQLFTKCYEHKLLLLQAVPMPLLRLNYTKSCWHKSHTSSADKSQFFHNCQVGKILPKKTHQSLKRSLWKKEEKKKTLDSFRWNAVRTAPVLSHSLLYIRLTRTQRKWSYGAVTIVTDEGEDEEWHGAGLLYTTPHPVLHPNTGRGSGGFLRRGAFWRARAASQGYCHSPRIRRFEVYSATVEFITLIVVSVTQGRRQMGGRNDCGREGECIKRVRRWGGGRVCLLCSWLIIGSSARGS